MIIGIFQCGHSAVLQGTEEARPVCPQCGAPLERVKAPKPRIKGTCSSPLKVA